MNDTEDYRWYWGRLVWRILENCWTIEGNNCGKKNRRWHYDQESGKEDLGGSNICN